MATFKLEFVPTYHYDTYDAISETNPDLSCKGKVVFVTGGGRGIGREIAKAFAVAGAKGIFIVGRTGTELLSAVTEIKSLSTGTPVSVYHAEADITDREAVASAFKQAIATFGHTDILIQNAGYLDAHRSLLESDLDDYWKTFEINVKGGLLVTQQFLKQSQPGDTIINVGSGAGHLPPIPGYSAYSASKLAFAKMIESVQLENPHLRVFNINPGAIATEMQKKSGDIAAVDNIRLPASYCVWLAASQEADCLKVVKLDDTKTENGQPTDDQPIVPDVYSDQSASVHNTDDLKALTASDEKGHSVEIRLRVSSAHLILSSPIFRAMLDGPFSEGIRSKDGFFEVKVFEWNAKALVIVLDIIHGHHRSLPQKVELDILIEIAMLYDYYQCEEIVETFAKQWITAFEEDKPYEEEATMNWMFVAWVFQREDLFNTKVAVTLQHSKIPVHTDLPLPSTILEKVEAQRLKFINDVLNNVYGLHESLWVTNDDCKPECASMLLGSLMKQMREAGLEIPKPKGLPSTIRSLVGLRRFASGLETPVCYIANRPF
ncbi:short-chain alcohol dehydrogenase/reductase [Fusarium denticulatum]|uniref:Short-chain alcohol dehydrogenase/reductase n=1 Tax=Fusarium denticulatum TaxID=48507 RepID=A0A8H5XKT3_9HYPO|nr:short-chain alcohol dehydrogenase/reductase [Fusarium denticulatum]